MTVNLLLSNESNTSTSGMVIARGDDWNGIYVNGMLVKEGHSFKYVEVAKLAMNCTTVEERFVDLGWLSDNGNFPSNIEEVEWEC